jgi:tRNA(Ile)-lysidine synthase
MTWTQLHAQLHRTIGHRRLCEKRQNLLVAVSGGQDSLCLIRLLLDLQPKWQWNIAIAHCDHRWRSDSEENAKHVANLARHWNLPFFLETAGINININSEASARNWRYQVLSNIAEEYGYNCVVTGHTATDRAETLLYNLIRGTGSDGLQALTWRRGLRDKIYLVRPLLEITRQETEIFCQKRQLPVWLDSTNKDLKYARNRVRQELIPYLQRNFNPKVEQSLAQTAELLQAEVEYLETEALKLRFDAQKSQSVTGEKEEKVDVDVDIASSSTVVRLNRQVLNNSAIAIQRRVMRQVLLEIMPSTPNFEHIEKLTALINAPNRSQTDPFPGGAIARVVGSYILIETIE